MPIKNIIPGQRVTKEKLQRAKELRREMTPAEAVLWRELRANKLGVHFRRQQVIAGFIVDFYCHPLPSSPKYDNKKYSKNSLCFVVGFGGGAVGGGGLKSMGIFTICKKQKIEDARRL